MISRLKGKRKTSTKEKKKKKERKNNHLENNRSPAFAGLLIITMTKTIGAQLLLDS